MVLRRSVKCLSVFFIIFLMCPRRTRLAAPVAKQPEYYQSARRTFNDFYNPARSILKAPQWPQYILRTRGDETFIGDDEEPGFDLSDDEIRKFKLWPKGIIPYYIDVLSFNDKVIRDRIRFFLNEVNSLTKLNFLEMPSPPKDDKTRWVFFVNRRGQLGCADHSIKNFTDEGVQQVILGYDCMSTGGELAEAVLAIAGVPPQHNSPDREDYIHIVHENIMPGKLYLFDKLKDDEWLFHDLKYDFTSAGHYHHHKYSLNGRATIETKAHYKVMSMGENNGFSFSDIKKIRMLYNYIVNNKEDKVPECEKLFRRGHNFHKGHSQKPHTHPRKKPNKYLGLPEEENEGHISENSEREEKNTDSKDREERNEENNADGEENVKISNEQDNENIEIQNLGSGSKENEIDKQMLIPPTGPRPRKRKGLTRISKKRPMDPLTYLSDYQTGDDRRRDGQSKVTNNQK